MLCIYMNYIQSLECENVSLNQAFRDFSAQ